MPLVTPLKTSDFVLEGRTLKLIDRTGTVIFFDPRIRAEVGLINGIKNSGGEERFYSLDTNIHRGVPMASRGSTTVIEGTPKIVGYAYGTPIKMFSANMTKTVDAVLDFAASIEEDAQQRAPARRPRRGGGGGGGTPHGGGGRNPGLRPRPRRREYEEYDEDPDEGSTFTIPPGVKPHNTPWVEIEEDF